MVRRGWTVWLLVAGCWVTRGEVLEKEGLLPGELGLDGLSFTLDRYDDWGTGACWNGLVLNASSEPVVWSVQTPSEGEIYDIWNAEFELDEGDWVFTGVSFNRSLEPEGTAEFGWCANR